MDTRFRLLFLAFFMISFFKLISQQTVPTKEFIAVIGTKNVQKKNQENGKTSQNKDMKAQKS